MLSKEEISQSFETLIKGVFVVSINIVCACLMNLTTSHHYVSVYSKVTITYNCKAVHRIFSAGGGAVGGKNCCDRALF